MSGRISTIKRWIKMLQGKSVFHMRQAEGLYYKKGEIKGYYSDLRHKVSGALLIDENGIPYNQTNHGNFVYFPITIFQYGLGAYDLYLETGDVEYKNKFLNVVKWTTENQNTDGSWYAFGWQNTDKPYSSMAQSEGASIFCRAYKELNDEQYLKRAENAMLFMLKPIEKGGCSRYSGDYLFLEESMIIQTILNGMMFSVWGLYEVSLISNNQELKENLDKSVNTLEVILQKYDCKYWSEYDLDGHIASPFYHDLHIEQLKVMYKLFEKEVFLKMQNRWEMYRNKRINGKIAFIVKAFQKLRSIDADIALVK